MIPHPDFEDATDSPHPGPKNMAELDHRAGQILDVLDDLTSNQRRDFKNVSEDDGRLLRLLTESSGAKNVVEIGTSNGYSGIWFCLALRKTRGRLITHEIDEGRAKLARESFKLAGVEDRVSLVMDNRPQYPHDMMKVEALTATGSGEEVVALIETRFAAAPADGAQRRSAPAAECTRSKPPQPLTAASGSRC